MEPVHVLLPCHGKPLKEVWLPKETGFGILTIPLPKLTSKPVSQLAGDHARSLGITDRAIRPLGSKRIGGVVVYPWVVWLKPGDAPSNLRCQSVDKAKAHPEFGSIVTDFQEYLANHS